MTWVAALFVVVAFLVLVPRLRVPRHVREVSARLRQARAAMRDPALDDGAKGRAVRGHSARLWVLFAKIVVGSALAFALPVGVVALLAAANVVDARAVLETSASPGFLLVAVALVIAAGAWRSTRPR